MKRDLLARTRLNQLRIDSARIRARIETARKHLFAAGALVNGTKVDGLLKKDSLVPTRVRFELYERTQSYIDILLDRMCSLSFCHMA